MADSLGQEGADERLPASPDSRAHAAAETATRVRRLVAAAALLVSGVFVVAAWDLDVGTSARPGPGLMPRLAAAGLALSAVLALLERVKPSAEVEDAPDSSGARRQLVVVGTLTAYVVALPFLGFLLASAVALSICSWIIAGSHRVGRAVVIGGVIALAVDASFRVLLDVGLPSGLWDIRTF